MTEDSAKIRPLLTRDIMSTAMFGILGAGEARFVHAGSETLDDQIRAILVKEESYQVMHITCRNHCECNNFTTYNEWRQKICQWTLRVVDHFQLDREIASVALNIFDRFLFNNSRNLKEDQRKQEEYKGNHINDTPSLASQYSCPSCTRDMNGRTYQLAAMTALYTAAKTYPENILTKDGKRRRRSLKLSSFVDLSQGRFSERDICEMEIKVLHVIHWRVCPPSPGLLVAYLLSLMPPLEDVPLEVKSTYHLALHVLQELSRYITELSMWFGGVGSTYPASYVAYAAIQVSMDLLTSRTLPVDVRHAFHTNVTLISVQSGGTLLHPHKQTIQRLKYCFSKSLLPEMLLDVLHNRSGGTGDRNSKSVSNHPIVIARDCGLLNMDKIQSRTIIQQGVSKTLLSHSCEVSPTSLTAFHY